jgi:ABC-2 type transport system permease protein
VAFALVANVLAAPLVGRPVVLTLRWALTILWLMPAVAALAVGALVIVSARVRGFQEAYQLGSLVVLPLIVLVVGQLAGVLYLDPIVLVLVGLVVWVIAIAALRAGYRGFRRERLLLQL